MTHFPRTFVAAVLAVLVAFAAAACGDENKESAVPEALQTSATTPFDFVENDGTSYFVGHGISLEVPADWKDYGEKTSFDGTTYESAVSEKSGDPFPAYIQFSMGIKGKGAPYDELVGGAEKLAEIDQSYEFLDKGSVDIPGAEKADFLRFNIDKTFEGQKQSAEQLQVFMKMPSGVTSVVRFIAPAGAWKETMEKPYESLQVSETNGSQA